MITLKCTNCGKEYEAERKTSKFCSANCRVKWNNKNLSELKEKVTTADKIPEKEQTKNSYTWVEEIENFCNQEGILPMDLISVYKSKNGPKEKYVSNAEKLGLKSYNGLSDWQIKLRNKKLGIKD